MLKRWLPKDRLKRQALLGLLVWAVCGLVAAGLGTLGDEHFRGHERGGKSVTQAVLQHGAGSPEAAAAVQQLGASGGPGTLVALIDPTTGTAVAAYPADLVGKKPEEITVDGARLPQLSYLLQGGHENEGEFGNGQRVRLQVSPVGAGADEHGDRGGRFGRKRMGPEGRGEGQGRGEGRTMWGRDGNAPLAPVGPTTAPQPPRPEPILVVASPVQPMSWTEIAAGIVGGVAALGFAVYWLSLAWWAFKDAQSRGKQAYAWGALVLVTNLAGLVAYLLLRNNQQECPSCGAPAGRGYDFCPSCGHALKGRCAHCGKRLKAGWQYCASCGTPTAPHDGGEVKE